MRAEEFDERFDRADDITSELDLSSLRPLSTEQRRVDVDPRHG
ncbi:hypothetical protein [Saccharomonospora iraqiensis]|nr:hypothetical protein [Saccharomonospora iraqiensis]